MLNPLIVLSTLAAYKSEDNSHPDMKSRISLVATVMSSMSRIWHDKVLQLSTDIRLYNGLVMSVLLYTAKNLDTTFV